MTMPLFRDRYEINKHFKNTSVSYNNNDESMSQIEKKIHKTVTIMIKILFKIIGKRPLFSIGIVVVINWL